MYCPLAGDLLCPLGLSVHSRHGTVQLVLQGKPPKDTRTGMRTDIGTCGDRLARAHVGASGLKKSYSTDRLAARLIRGWIRDVFLFPCQARKSGLPVAASPVPASPPHGLRGTAGRLTNHNARGPHPEDARRLLLATQRWLSPIVSLQEPANFLGGDSQLAVAYSRTYGRHESHCTSLSGWKNNILYTHAYTVQKRRINLQGRPT